MEPPVAESPVLRANRLQEVLQRMVVPQLVELDIFFEALERGVAGELLEAGDVHAGGDAARDRPAPQAVAGGGRRLKPREAGPGLYGQPDPNRVDRGAAAPQSPPP